MRTLLPFFIFFALLNLPMNAQDSDQLLILSKLVDKGYLDTNESKIILDEYQEVAQMPDFRSYLLSQMADLSAYKLFKKIDFPLPLESHRGASGMLMSSFGRLDDFFPNKEVQVKRVWQLSADLIELKLATPQSEKEIRETAGDHLIHEAGLLFFYSYKAIELSQLPRKRKEQEKRMADYQSEGLFVDGFMETETAKAPDFVEAFDLVRYLKYSKIFELEELPIDPVEGYREIYEQTLVTSPEKGLSLSSIDVREEEDEEGYKEMWVNVSIFDGERIILDTFSTILLKDRETGLRTARTELVGYIIKVVNKALILRDDRHRLYYFKPANGSNSIGVAYLTRREYLVIKEQRSRAMGFLTGPHPERAMSPSVMEELLLEAKGIRLIPDTVLVSVAKDSLRSIVDILVAYDIPEKNALFIKPLKYSNIIQQLARLSKGAFNPTNILESVSEDNQTLTLIFDLAGENKTVVVTKDGMGFYLDFLKKMGRVISGLNLDGEFCSIGNGPDSVGLAYLTLEQKEWIDRNGSDLWVGSYLR